MDDAFFTKKIMIHSGSATVQLGRVALLNRGSPQTLLDQQPCCGEYADRIFFLKEA